MNLTDSLGDTHMRWHRPSSPLNYPPPRATVLAQMPPSAGMSPDGSKSRVLVSVPRGHGDLRACKEKHQKLN